MNSQVFRIDHPQQYRTAGPDDLIRMVPLPGANGHSLFLPKRILEVIVYAICHAETLHVSGPTGTAKSSVLEALHVSENFVPIVTGLGFPVRPLCLYPVEMATFDSPGEMYQRRALRDGTTYDEPSSLVTALQNSAKTNGSCYSVIWLREIGRVHSSAVQGGLLDLIPPPGGSVTLPDGSRVGGQVCFIADSNYQAESDSTYTLVTFDDALRRRFNINLTLDYLPSEQEVQVLAELFPERRKLADGLLDRVVRLGQRIRLQRQEGSLLSLPAPTIAGYVGFLRMIQRVPHLSVQQIAMSTLLGNASLEDRRLALAVFNEVFGLQQEADDDSVLTERGLF